MVEFESWTKVRSSYIMQQQRQLFRNLVHPMAQYGVDAVYLDYGSCTYKGNPTGCYNNLSLVNLKALAAAVQAG